MLNHQGVIHSAYLAPANQHDARIMPPTVEASVTDLRGKTCYADSGYAGKNYIKRIHQSCQINLVSRPKKTRNPTVMSHTLSPIQTLMLQKHRNLIERINQNIRNFRSLMIKHVKKIDTYRTYLFLAIMCINIHMITSATQ